MKFNRRSIHCEGIRQMGMPSRRQFTSAVRRTLAPWTQVALAKQELPAPWQPQIADEQDTSNFDEVPARAAQLESDP